MLVTLLDAPNTASTTMDKNSNCAPTKKIMYVDWELAFPSVRIECFHCKEISSNSTAVGNNSSAAPPHFLARRDTTNFAKIKITFPYLD
jgi:hypothetical protein